ncbi:MAG: glycoside hydrolase family 3 C-terminal domain-containing protein [Polyangiaceae bacterium]|nr:glycoside hydrolase family 3 C-terminal domain-containing protein [Polyangiaceae bacterium]
MAHAWSSVVAIVSGLGACACGSTAERARPSPQDAVERRVEEWLAELTLEEKVEQMHGSGFAPVDDLYGTAENARLGIPSFWMVDGPRGVRAGRATTFPVGIARGATWDVDLEREIGEAMGRETAAKGGNVLLAPTINVLRHPRWGRAQETYGEDPAHLGALGVAFVEGVQRHVLASAKHFAANSIENTRLSVSVELDERALREIYTPHFERVVRDANVASVMSAYNRVNGEYCAENEVLLRTLLKDGWGFDGFVESDWLAGTRSTVGSALGGLDIEMPVSNHYGFRLVAAVQAGEVPEATIDDSVRRILRRKLQYSLDTPAARDPAVVESAPHVELARRAAREGIVLLRNVGGALPLDRAAIGRLAVVGRLADVPRLGDEGSSNAQPTRAVSPLAGIVAGAGGISVESFLTSAPSSAELDSISGADAAVVVIALEPDDEGEKLPGGGGDRSSLALPAEDVALLQAVSARQPRTLVVLEAGGPVLTEPWISGTAAVLMAWYPGMEGGHALAEILFGDHAPSGRLPAVFPVQEADLPPFDATSDQVTYGLLHGQAWLDARGTEAAFPLGFGLGYSTIRYDAIGLDGSSIAADGSLTASVTVTNTGARAQAEVVQLYASVVESAIERAPVRLVGFARVELAPGEAATVEIPLRGRDLAYWDAAAQAFVLEPAGIVLSAGPSAAERPVSAAVTPR